MATLREETKTPPILFTDFARSTAPGISETTQVYKRATAIGFSAGLRSMMPMALLSGTQRQRLDTIPEKNVLTGKQLLAAAAIGEIVADKFPFMPSRLRTGSFLGRIAIGALAGAILCRRANHPMHEGALRGAIGACIGTLGGYTLRTLLSQGTDIPDGILALLEDIIAFRVGLTAVQPLEEN